MKKKCFFYLYICFLLACSSKKSVHTNPNSIEITFNSSDTSSILASLDLTEQEKKCYTDNFTVVASSSTNIPLIDNYHLLGLQYYPSYYGEIIVAKGDKIIVEQSNGKLVFSKQNDDERTPINTIEQQLIFDSQQYSNLQKQTQLLLDAKSMNKSQRDMAMSNLLKFDKAYYDDVCRNIEKKYKSEEQQRLLIKFAKIQQYENLSKINARIKNDTLTQLLKSKQFLNENNLNDRVLSKLFGCYNYYNLFKHPMDKPLTEKYKSDFNSFSIPLQRYFKRLVISSLINDKYDRKIISTFINDYERNYGKHKDVELMKKEIEYGIEESKDLQLMGIDNKHETWETLMQKWKGRKVYVDFWASWCNPCIGELPYSKKIKTELKEVVFIYLALNDKEEAWRKAIVKHNIVSNSYLITNSKSSKFIIDHEIQAIPRYMILDKRGKIINPDAPRPSSDNIKQALKDF